MSVASITCGDSTIYYAPVGEATPDPDTIPWGTAWGGNWATFGLTNAPLTFDYQFETKDVEVQESLAPVKSFKINEMLKIATSQVEIEAVLLGIIFSRPVVTTAAASGVVGREDILVGGICSIDEYAWGIEGLYQDDSGNQFPIRIFIWKAAARLTGAIEFDKANELSVPFEATALADLTRPRGEQLFQFQRVTDVALP